MMGTDSEGFRWIALPRIIGFEPKGAELLSARQELRECLTEMRAGPGEFLHGVIEGPGATGTDIDNALLYDIGGSVGGATRNGVILERRPGSGVEGVRYRYRLAPEADRLLVPDPVATLEGVELEGKPEHWWEIWKAVMASPGVEAIREAPSRDLVLSLRLDAPTFAGVVNGEFVKRLIDGVLTALHGHEDALVAEEVGQRLSERLALPPRQIVQMLLDNDCAVLGTCRRLIGLRDSGVQCHPEDVRLAAFQLEVVRDAARWGLSGVVAERAA